MKLHEVITKAYNTAWSYTNNFTVQFNQSPYSDQYYSIFMNLGDELNAHIVDVSLPDFVTSQVSEAYSVDRYRFTLGVDQPLRFTITFMDSDDMRLWRDFIKLYESTKLNYFDDCKFEVSIYKDSDYHDDREPVHLITYTEVIIEQVNKITLNNEEEAKISRFTVSFKQQKFKLD